MAEFYNKQGITEITFTQNIQCFCPLGNDWYTNHVEVNMIPDETIPDYCDVDDFLRGLAGKSLIIEDVVDAIYSYLCTNYKPKSVRVQSSVDDAKHLPVTVVKQ